MSIFGMSDERRKDELIRTIENTIERLQLEELEALYYDMVSKGYINMG